MPQELPEAPQNSRSGEVDEVGYWHLNEEDTQ